MKAPDKIYILCTDNGDLGDASLYPEGERSKEYIRKDALLEWAKENEEIIRKRLKDTTNNQELFTRGLMYNVFIDKIESL